VRGNDWTGQEEMDVSKLRAKLSSHFFGRLAVDESLPICEFNSSKWYPDW